MGARKAKKTTKRKTTKNTAKRTPAKAPARKSTTRARKAGPVKLDGKKVLRSEVSVVDETLNGDDYDAFVAAQSRLLEIMSKSIAHAIKEQLAILEQAEALEAAAGAWKDEDHPDLATDEDA